MATSLDRTITPAAAASDGQPLDSATVHFTRGPLGEFRCEIDGDQCYLNCRASRCFPLSNKDQYVALFDGLKGEIGVLQDLTKLDKTSRELVSELLERRYFLPVITHVKSIREEFSVIYWSVETNVGPRDFVCRGMRDSVKSLSDTRLLVTDADGNRFEIADYTSLSRSAQAIIDRVL